jgi:cytochrome c biogenesis protein CcmG/thiol:disulfide interchange protein DsbE
MFHRPALLSVVLAAFAAFDSGCAAPAHVTAPPSSVPSESVVTLDGRSTDLASMLHGHVALVSFWATWCAACDREIDALNRLSARTVAEGDTLVVGVAVGESRETVDAYVRKRGLRYTQVLDEDFRLADALGQRDVPATLVVDRSGRIVYRGDALDSAGLAAFSEARDRH